MAKGVEEQVKLENKLAGTENQDVSVCRVHHPLALLKMHPDNLGVIDRYCR